MTELSTRMQSSQLRIGRLAHRPCSMLFRALSLFASPFNIHCALLEAACVCKRRFCLLHAVLGRRLAATVAKRQRGRPYWEALQELRASSSSKSAHAATR